MTTSGIIINQLSVATGMSFHTVESYARNLRDAGLISIRGHGPSSARWTTTDVINLVIALASADTRAGAFKAVESVRALKAKRGKTTAGEALDAMFDQARSGTLPKDFNAAFIDCGSTVLIRSDGVEYEFSRKTEPMEWQKTVSFDCLLFMRLARHMAPL